MLVGTILDLLVAADPADRSLIPKPARRIALTCGSPDKRAGAFSGIRPGRAVAALSLVAAAACAPTSQLPDLSTGPRILPQVSDSIRALAKALAPILHLQHDEPFDLLRVAAVVHPTRPVIAFHLLWSHDVNGQWVPWAQPSDEEEVWVGYDPATGAPSDLWTYWHGTILHTPWRDHARPAADVQWGKHGSFPEGTIESDLPHPKTLNAFYAGEFLLLPDILLGKLAHGGPWGFFHGYGRYRLFDRTFDTADHLDAVLVGEDPRDELRAVFGPKFSNKRHWP